MKSHAYRPLFVVLAVVGMIFLARVLVVPDDFGAHESGYMYGWHRKGNEEDWKNFKVKYRTMEYCKDCHYENHAALAGGPHAIIECENCHGPAVDHPAEPARLEINRTRRQCLRCHAYLPYEASGRTVIPPIEDREHNPGTECVTCHNPHKPGFG